MMMPMSARSPGKNSLSLLSTMNLIAAGRRLSSFSRSCGPVKPGCGSRIMEKSGFCTRVIARDISLQPVVLGGEAAIDVAGADAQLHHHERVRRFGKFEALFDAG